MVGKLVAALVVLLGTVGCGVSMQKYEIVSTTDKYADFTKFKTYVWETGWPAYEEDVNKEIVAAVDRQLAALHFTESTDGRGDVTVSYGMLRRTDADLKAAGHAPDRELPTFPVVTVIVKMRDTGTLKELFTARSDAPIGLDGKIATINDQVAQIFERYPTVDR